MHIRNLKAKRIFVSITVISLSALALLDSAPPPWWAARAVMDESQDTNDYAGVNVGQLKHIAKRAAEELDARLPGGAGVAVHSLIASFSDDNPERNDFSAVNVGQVKAVAKPFYDRLIAVGFAESKPWVESGFIGNDYAMANTGQVKNVFSFNLSVDTDSDGLPDWWEMDQFGSLSATADGDMEGGTGDGLTNLEECWLEFDPQSAAESASAPAVGIVIYTNLE